MQDTAFPNLATPLGSTAYYVVRFSPAESRDQLAALFLWKQELVNLYALTDPGVARMKLQWWQEQILLPARQPSSHTLALAIARLIQQDKSLGEAIRLMVQETDRHLHRQHYRDFKDFRQGCENIGAGFAQLISTACRTGSAVNDDIHRAVGTFNIASEWLQLMGQHIRYNIRLLPDSMLEQHNIRFESLLQQDKQHVTREILGELYQLLSNEIDLPAPNRSSSPLDKYFRLRKKTMELLATEDFDVLDQKISLTPIRKLWFAL